MANVNVSVLHPPPPMLIVLMNMFIFLVNNKQEYIKV